MSTDKLPQNIADRVAVIEAELAEVRTQEATLLRQREELYAAHALSRAVFKVGDYVRRNQTAWTKEGHVLKVMRVEARVFTVPAQRIMGGSVEISPERVSCAVDYTCRTVTASGNARGRGVTFTSTHERDYKKVPAPPKVTP